MSDYWILDGHTPVAVDLMTWGKWLEVHRKKRVAATEKDGVRVSTVFLGMNHEWNKGMPPLLFETMIFGGEHDEYQERCSTWKQAEEMHATACKLAFGEQV